jgi:ribosomal protein S18 acetylase RimI-like enzyme
VNIRAFRASDTDDVIALWTACDLVVLRNDPHKDIARKLAVNPELFLVGEIGGETGLETGHKIVASGMGGYEGHRGWINYLAVDPLHQGKSYGRKIMEAVETLLQELGCPKINLQVRSSNEAVQQFYESLGYGRDDVVGMGKRLAPDD